MGEMKVFTCDDFVGHYPVGSAAVVVAEDAVVAHQLLWNRLNEIGLPQSKPLKMTELDTSGHKVEILVDGNY